MNYLYQKPYRIKRTKLKLRLLIFVSILIYYKNFHIYTYNLSSNVVGNAYTSVSTFEISGITLVQGILALSGTTTAYNCAVYK